MSTQLKPAVSSKDYVQGNTNAAIELVEHGDYQCGHCGHAYGIIKGIQQKLGKNLQFIFRNFPLAESHPNAVKAAVAAEAAALQNKFWEMHDILFENQQQLEDEDLLAYAKEIGLYLQQFENDFKDEKLLSKVEADMESGIRSGVNGTPSFFVNGKKYNGDWEEEEFNEYLVQYLS